MEAAPAGARRNHPRPASSQAAAPQRTCLITIKPMTSRWQQ